MGDLNPVLERIIALRQSIVDDGIANGVPFHIGDQQTLVERLKSEGTSFVKVTLPLLGRALDKALVSGDLAIPKGFKLRRDTRLPAFCGRVFDMIFDAGGVLRAQPHLGSIFFLRQYLLLDGKLVQEPTIEQENVAFNEFVTRQCLLRQRPVPIGHPVVERAARLLTGVLSGLDLSDIQPGHGPGGVAEGLDRAERWGFATWPRRAERWYPYSEYGTPSFMGSCEMTPPVMVDQSITRCCLVPKDFRGPRLISAESAATQYLQQGQMRSMMSYIDKHSLLMRSIRLRDQTFNQKACREAYANGACTLDLSNASDNVSAVLVWHLLRGVPRLRSQLFSTRSQAIRLGREKVILASFSPMGSAVCFPVETLVFWALSLASIRHVHAQWAKETNVFDDDGISSLPTLEESASCLAVFGDDIILPDYARETLVGTLREVGCEINESKSCYRTPFRESCGSEWYNDTDVSITRNRKYHYDSARRIVDYPGLLDLQRKFFLQGLVRSAALLSQWAREIAPIVTVGIQRFSSSLAGRVHLESAFKRGMGCSRSLTTYSRPLGDRKLAEQDNGGSATAFPSGLDCFIRSSVPFDKYCAAIGWDTSLDSGVPTRYNPGLQRVECRLPTIFQQCRKWPSVSPGDREYSGEVRSVLAGRDNCHKKAAFLRLITGYPRLLARITGDYVDRIAILGQLRLKMAWSESPSSYLSVSS